MPQSVRLSVLLSVPERSCSGRVACVGYSHRRPPEMCGLRTRLRTDVDPPRVELVTNYRVCGMKHEL